MNYFIGILTIVLTSLLFRMNVNYLNLLVRSIMVHFFG